MSDKHKRVASILKKLESKKGADYGKIHIMDGSTVEEVPRISTGLLSLDLACGGGYPQGRIIEVSGPESSGKCLTADTFINTGSGLLSVAEVFEMNNVVPSCSSNIVSVATSLYNRNSELEDTTHLTCNNKRSVFKVTTRTGRVVKATGNHPLLVMGHTGFLTWKPVKQLTESDYLVAPRRSATYFGNVELDMDVAYGLGVLTADGGLEARRVAVTNDDPDVKHFIESRFMDLFGFSRVRFYPNNDKGSVNYHFSDKVGVDAFYNKFGLTAGLAKDKLVPKLIRTGTEATVRAFIQGYMDCESYVSSDKGFEVVSASFELVYVLKLLLEFFGILSILGDKPVKAYPDNKYYRLTITGPDAVAFINTIGTRSSKVEARYASYIVEHQTGSTNHDSIPYLKALLGDLYSANEQRTRETQKIFNDYITGKANVSYARLQKLIEVSDDHPVRRWLEDLAAEHYYFDEVVSVEGLAAEPTFDFAMSKTHSFIANGVISHNTTLTLHAIAAAQQAGGVCAFVDAEYSLDLTYAKHLGVDVDNMLLSQPDCGEQALDVAIGMAETMTWGDIIVIDSIAAIRPRSLLTDSMEDMSKAPGVHARMLSIGLPKLNEVASKSGVLIYCTNQLRSLIGVTYGPTTGTTGGNTLKFYASQRFEVKRKGQIKAGDHPVGVEVEVTVTKNKVAPPFRKALTANIFGEGMAAHVDVLQAAIRAGIVKKAGSWLSYEGIQLGQGFLKSAEFLKGDPASLELIRQHVLSNYGAGNA